MRESGFATCLGIITSLIVLFVVGLLINGWALSTIWNWFVPPIFGLTALTTWKAIGVSMVISLFTGTNNLSAKTEDNYNKSYSEVFYTSLLKVVLVPVFSVCAAWVVVQFAF